MGGRLPLIALYPRRPRPVHPPSTTAVTGHARRPPRGAARSAAGQVSENHRLLRHRLDSLRFGDITSIWPGTIRQPIRTAKCPESVPGCEGRSNTGTRLHGQGGRRLAHPQSHSHSCHDLSKFGSSGNLRTHDLAAKCCERRTARQAPLAVGDNVRIRRREREIGPCARPGRSGRPRITDVRADGGQPPGPVVRVVCPPRPAPPAENDHCDPLWRGFTSLAQDCRAQPLAGEQGQLNIQAVVADGTAEALLGLAHPVLDGVLV